MQVVFTVSIILFVIVATVIRDDDRLVNTIVYAMFLLARSVNLHEIFANSHIEVRLAIFLPDNPGGRFLW